jgi:hypothetical protein
VKFVAVLINWRSYVHLWLVFVPAFVETKIDAHGITVRITERLAIRKSSGWVSLLEAGVRIGRVFDGVFNFLVSCLAPPRKHKDKDRNRCNESKKTDDENDHLKTNLSITIVGRRRERGGDRKSSDRGTRLSDRRCDRRPNRGRRGGRSHCIHRRLFETRYGAGLQFAVRASPVVDTSAPRLVFRGRNVSLAKPIVDAKGAGLTQFYCSNSAHVGGFMLTASSREI